MNHAPRELCYDAAMSERRETMRDLFAADAAIRAFTLDEIDAIRAAGRQRSYAAGDLIVEANARGNSMFVLREGEVVVELPLSDDVILGPGSYFGELSFINPDHRRSATIRARTACTVDVLDQGSVDQLSREHPKALLTLLRRTTAFLVEKEEQLIRQLRAEKAELERTLDYLRRTREEADYQELLAQTDGLTGLYNRRCLDAQLPRFIERAARGGRGLAVIMLDLDHFKPVNDTLGHAAGDAVLKAMADVLRGAVRSTDLPCRLGGDEFTVVLADIDEEQARARAEELRRAVEAMPQPGREAGVVVTTTVGGAMYVPGERPEDLMARADAHLYEAKEAGRNRVSWGARGG